ncbi:MAG: GGDEF domain-containing protein [Rhodanobacteraceae bacterium]|nr:GGDEF domain-containing protein [Rhodanobacteraceae bacterium]
MLANLLSVLENNAGALWLAAVLLALGFRRNRYVLVLAALAVPIQDTSLHPVVLLGVATLVWVVVVTPEPPLRSLRSLATLGCALALPWLPEYAPTATAILAPAAAWHSPRPTGFGAGAWLTVIAAGWAMLRWLRHGWPLDLYLALALLPVILAFSQGAAHGPRAWLAVSAACIGIAVLYGAYRMAFIDALTGLPNRRALDERLARSIGRIAVAMVDVDHFKRFNDRHGHEAGDRVLRAVARRLRRCRGGDAYRYGGEEFAIVFEGRQVDNAGESLELVRGEVEALRVRLGTNSGKRAQAVRRGQGDGEVGVTVSIGVAERDPERRTCAAVIDAADKALYRSKQRGRNRLTLAGAARS